jgi:HD-GYP domain-containing protein (c-di-GMP phosphodiesterase class II)
MNEANFEGRLLSADVTSLIADLDGNVDIAGAAAKRLEDLTASAIRGFSDANRHTVDHVTTVLMQMPASLVGENTIKVLGDACFYYSRIGRAFDGIPRGIAARKFAETRGLKNLERLAGNALGAAYVDAACFEDACRTFERTLVLAREIGDPLRECVALTNTAALLKDMGLYRDAIEVIDRALAFKLDSPGGRYVHFGSAVNGLFSAHRLRDEAAALRFMRIGSELLDDNPMADVVLKTNFEYFRAMYLLHKNDHETAELLVSAAKQRTANLQNGRVHMMLDIAAALCDWASRDRVREGHARKRLRELYHTSKQSRLYHDDVLRALVEVHKRTLTGETDPPTRGQDDRDAGASAGLDALRQLVMQTSETGVHYAKELVDYTAGPRSPAMAGKELIEFSTGVKNAKFYRQLHERGALDPEAAPATAPATPFDPFVGVRRWLDDDRSTIPLGDITAPFRLAKAPAGPSEVRKHDELSAIHSDIAALRANSLRVSIRTAAYDVAENWALAAEFLDDQTGEHCFRVGRLAGLLAAEVGIDPENCLRIEHAARLHDIGKIAVNEMILLKPGPLDAAEIEAMRAHTEVGAHLLEGSADATLKLAATVAKYHHAWWNGAGYPSVSGESIPLAARICALADVYDALTHVRPYKRAWPHKLAVEQILCESGAHFDPRLMRPFLTVLERHVGSTSEPPSTKAHLKDMEVNGLLASRRSLMMTLQAN